MVDMTSNVNQFAGDAQRRIASGTEFGVSMFRPILHWQVLMLRMWADSIERLAGNYEQGAHEVASAVREHAN
jgi:hypothetical protein